MRETPNFDDANFALRLYDLRRETELRKARTMVGELLDGAPYETFQAVMDYAHPENAHFRQVTSYWGMCASFVNRGIFHPEVFIDTCGEAIYLYSVFQPHLPRLRAENPSFMLQIQKVIDDHPAVRERLAIVDKMRAAWQAKEAAAIAAKPVKPAKSVKATKPAQTAKPASKGTLAKSKR